MSIKYTIELINGCAASTPKVFPPNWKTGGKELLKKQWEIRYYFNDPVAKRKDPELYKKNRKVRKWGMNDYKTLAKRREACELIIELEIEKLTKQHYNPIYETYMFKSKKVNNTSTLIECLQNYLEEKDISPAYLTDMNSLLERINICSINIGLQYTPINNITRKDIRDILKEMQKKETFGITNKRFNKYKGMLSGLFNDMIEDELIKVNPCDKIKNLKTESSLREVVQRDEMKKIYMHLKENYYTFWRFMMIYYSSGARVEELLRLQLKDINVKNLEFKVRVKKGGVTKEVLKPINKSYYHLWIEAITEDVSKFHNVNNQTYLFSKGLQKGESKIRYEQITRRWKVHVKNKLGVTADFASLTHTYLDQVTAQVDARHAQKLRSHTTDRMVKQHYAINEKQREMELLKSIDIPFYSDET